MPTVTQSSDSNKIQAMKPNGVIAAMTNPEQLFSSSVDQEKAIKLTSLLQTSLNVEELLTQLNNELREILFHDHVAYINEQHNINFVIGTRSRHSCTYELTINELKLGLITFTRENVFSAKDVETLENLLCSLHYPLRNALLYNEAINAAHKDPLTGVGNRGAMSSALHREIELAFRHNRTLGIIMMDVDHFKTVNDQYGHAAGDLVLKSLMKCTEDSVRISDLVYRFGGEEFVIVLPETDESGVLRLAKRIRRRVEKLDTNFQNQSIGITVSIGVTTLHDSDDENLLIARVDEALYRAKREGRNCIRIANIPNAVA